MKKKISLLIGGISLIIFLIILIFVKKRSNLTIDTEVYNFISKLISSDMTRIFLFITFLGSAVFVIFITILTLLFLKNKKIGIFLAINLVSITIFQYLLKYLVLRPRPTEINIIEEKGYSFPSGHSLTAMAFYGFIIYLVYKTNLKYKKIYIVGLSLIILLIGLSRVYLGVHHITDVIAGFMFSIFYLTIFIKIYQKYKLK